MALDSAAWSIDSSAGPAFVFRRSPSAPWALAALGGPPRGPDRCGGARKQIGLARDAGNLFDTADIYSRGLSEEMGKALGSDRDDVLIGTKVRNTMGDGPNDAGRLGTTSSVALRTPAARHRLHRPLPATRVGWAHLARGNAARP